MLNSTTHPEEALLASYSAASLPLSQALCVSVHIEHCDDCKQKALQLDQLGSELMLQLDPAPAAAGLKQALLDRIDALDAEEQRPATSVKNSLIPRGLQQFVKTDYTALAWKRVTPDIHSVELCRDSNGAKVELLRIKPGGKANTHTHLGEEYTVILQGSFSDEAGLYKQGDFMLRDPQVEHTPVATLNEECICLTVTEAPIQFTGFFNQLLNPLLRRAYR